MRKLLTNILSEADDIELVGTAMDAFDKPIGHVEVTVQHIDRLQLELLGQVWASCSCGHGPGKVAYVECEENRDE